MPKGQPGSGKGDKGTIAVAMRKPEKAAVESVIVTSFAPKLKPARQVSTTEYAAACIRYCTAMVAQGMGVEDIGAWLTAEVALVEEAEEAEEVA